MSAAVPDTFQLRVRKAFHGKYHQVMRRSLQAVVLWEAHRSLESRYPELRPFQRKYALFATAVELLKTLDFLDYYQRQEVMFRTIASREPVPAEVAWKRMKVLERDIESTILPRVRDLLAADLDGDTSRTHDELCEVFLQGMHDESREGKEPAPRPPNWEFKHNHVFAVYRVYYRGVDPDPAVFPATPPKVVEVARGAPVPDATGAPPAPPPRPSVVDEIRALGTDARRGLVREVREHTELLNAFVGLVPDAEIAARKRALYELLPAVPFSLGGATKRKRKRRTPKPAVVAPPALAAALEPGAGAEGVAAVAVEPDEPDEAAASDEAAAPDEAAEPDEAEDWERALEEEAAQSVAVDC